MKINEELSVRKMNEKIIKQISKDLKIREDIVEKILEMLAEGNTVHFLARYRKEQIGGVDEEVIRAIDKVYQYEVQLQERKQVIKERIADQGMLTDELAQAIDQSEKLVQLEQLYEPYKSKRITKAKLAIDGGLLPLAQLIMKFGKESLTEEAAKYINEHFETVEDVLENVGYLLAQQISENVELREAIKRHHYKMGQFATTVTKKGPEIDEEKVFEQYYDFSNGIGRVANHQVLAVNRAEKLKVIRVKLTVDEEKVLNYVLSQYLPQGYQNVEFFTEVAQDALKRLILPSISREVRSELTTRAQSEAIKLFGQNVHQLLMQQPIEKQTMLGFDPAFRTGCKLAVIDGTGKLEDISVIYPHQPVNKQDEAKKILDELYKKHKFTIIAIGNGTASRESEQFVGEWIRENDYPIAYTLVSEAGASVYSASKKAIEEFPDLSVEQRSAISIARRILDPLAELIKIDPKSLGVGQYQHDLSPKELNDELAFVVDHSVNTVGVDLNTASGELLSYISGISATTAKNIVDFREENNGFSSRAQLKKVKGLGPKAFEQAAGFLRIIDSKEVFDNTAIHPESYKIAKAVLKNLGIDASKIGTEEMKSILEEKKSTLHAEAFATDKYTLESIVESFDNPTRDARETYSAPLLRQDVLSIDDIVQGMKLEGVVRNITDFGAFIDIGLKNDGFVHVSKMSKQFVHHPSAIVQIGEIHPVTIENVDLEKGRVELTLL